MTTHPSIPPLKTLASHARVLVEGVTLSKQLSTLSFSFLFCEAHDGKDCALRE